MPSSPFHVDAALFDMDGTLVDSTAGVEGAWEVFKEKYPSIDIGRILSSAHGVRTVENLRNYCGITDPKELETEAERFETSIVLSASANGRKGIVLLPGVKEVITEIATARFLPGPSWAICTSATRKYATAALNAAGVPIPEAFVVSEDVEKGKPYPDPYLLGAERCGVKPQSCVVFEDAPAGVRSGKAAGCKTVGFLTTHSKKVMEAAQPDFLVTDMASITIRLVELGGLEVTVNTEE